MSTGRSVAVVGAEGWQGAAITRALRERLFHVVAIAESNGPRWHLEDLGLQWVDAAPGLESLDLEALLADVQALVLPLGENPPATHLRGANKEGGSGRADRLRRFRSVLEIARTSALRVILVSSTATVVERIEGSGVPEKTLWSEDYRYYPGLARREDVNDLITQEEEAYRYISAGADVVVLNCGAPSGPGDTSAQGLEYLRRARALPDDAKLCFCDVRDVAHGVTHALVHGRRGRRYVLGAEPLMAREYVAAWEAALGSDGVPERSGSLPLAETDLLWWAPEVDARRARHELGFRPRDGTRSVHEGAQWLRRVGLLTMPPRVV